MRKKKLLLAGGIILIVAFGIFLMKGKFTDSSIYYQGESLEKSMEESVSAQGSEAFFFQGVDGTVESNVMDGLKAAKESNETIVWVTAGVGSEPVLPGERLKWVNELLKKRKLPFQMAVCYLDDTPEGYRGEMEKLLEEGYGDVFYTNSTFEGQEYYPQNHLIRKGYFKELDSYLETEEGKKLWDTLEGEEWKQVRMEDDKIYTVPNQYIFADRNFVCFNKKYISKKKADAFSGDISTLGEYISSEMKDGLGRDSLHCSTYYWGIADAMGYYEIAGLLGNHETGEIRNPLEVDEIHDIMELLWKCNNDGTLYTGEEDDYTFGKGIAESTESLEKTIDSGEYGILIFRDTKVPEKLLKDAYVVELPNYYVRGTQGSFGVAKESEKAEKALGLMQVLYSDAEIANALVLGEEGVDYKLGDGYVYGLSGEEKEGFVVRQIFGCNNLAHTGTSGRFGPDIVKGKKEFFASEYHKRSVFAGFQPDSDKWGDSMKAGIEAAASYYDLWRAKDFEKEYRKAREKIKGETEKLRENIQKQYDTWKERE